MLVSELRGLVKGSWNHVEVCGKFVTDINGKKVTIGQGEPMFGHEVLEELEGKNGKLEIKI